MILNPRTPVTRISKVVSAWQAVERTQRQSATEWWVIAQPDHAALAGEMASRIESELFPEMDGEVVQAIALHDEGWRGLDSSPITENGQPVSFLEMPVAEFLVAWRDSILRAEAVAPVAGILVSEHFRRLGQYGLSRELTEAEANRIREFVAQEAQRQQILTANQDRSPEEIRVLVDVLQFCDLLSLYLCCGSPDDVEFPQTFKDHHIRLIREGKLYRTDPGLFADGVSLAITARGYPRFGDSVEIPILLR